MPDIKKLETLVAKIYVDQRSNYSDRDEWADWLFEHHVMAAADYAFSIADEFGADPKVARAAALLHDIADAKVSRFDPKHQEITKSIAEEFMSETGFSREQRRIVTADALPNHSCNDGLVPKTAEGKALATADAMAHFLTDYYVVATWKMGKNRDLEEVKSWVLKKIEKDYHKKIFSQRIRKKVESDYVNLKNLYSR